MYLQRLKSNSLNTSPRQIEPPRTIDKRTGVFLLSVKGNKIFSRGKKLTIDQDLELPEEELQGILEHYTELNKLASEATQNGQPVLAAKYQNDMKVREWLFGIQEVDLHVC